MQSGVNGHDGSNLARWELYRLLGEPFRLRLLVLAGEDELSMGELAELLGESQPNVSKHVSVLRRAGLLSVRKQGTRVFVRLPIGAEDDPLIRDALVSGRRLCEDDGSLARVALVVQARDRAVREFFDRSDEHSFQESSREMPAYLAALAPLISPRGLAIDAGTGDGRLLDILAPLFTRVVALDRSAAQLDKARARVVRRGYANVELIASELDAPELLARLAPGADLIFASRILHHAPRPKEMLAAMTRLTRPGGAIVVLDYQAHQDEALRERQADIWLGFDARELIAMADEVGLESPSLQVLPAGFRGGNSATCDSGVPGAHVHSDFHLGWHALFARRPSESISQSHS